MRKKLLIIIPVYNEEKNIRALLEEMKKQKIHEMGQILVINDGSTDRTEEIVLDEQVEIISKPTNMGYGSTLQLGYKYGARNDYDYLIQIDGDGQHDVAGIRTIYEALVGKRGQDEPCPDLVIGSRFLHNDNVMKVSRVKKFAIWFFKKIIKLVTGKTITDPTSGFQGLNRRAFGFYAGYSNFDYQYPDLNMIIQMLMLGYQIEEVPVKMYEREAGKSMHSGFIKPILYMVLILIGTLNVILRQSKSYVKKDDYYG